MLNSGVRKAMRRAGSTVYQTVYHGMRYCDQTRVSRIFGPKEKPAEIAGFSGCSLVALTGIEPVF
jgi:hypothetical protein